MRFGLMLGALCMLVGCSGGSGGTTVSGTAKFSDGGALSKGVVSLTGETGTFTGTIGADGTFSIEDVLPGTYTGLITGVMDKEANDTEMMYDANGNYVEPKPEDEPKSLIKAEYSDSTQSPIKITVPSESYDISVDKV